MTAAASETWAPIPGYEGAYEVSDLGRVRSLDRVDARGHKRRGRILAPGNTGGNRLTVVLCVGGAQRTYHISQLVLLAFVGPRPDRMESCHWNDDPADNRLENLRWDTRSANALDSVRNGNNRNAKKTHCPQGHAYTPENTYHGSRGSRICCQCHRHRPRERNLA